MACRAEERYKVGKIPTDMLIAAEISISRFW